MFAVFYSYESWVKEGPPKTARDLADGSDVTSRWKLARAVAQAAQVCMCISMYV
jgi:hypothetical protein